MWRRPRGVNDVMSVAPQDWVFPSLLPLPPGLILLDLDLDSPLPLFRPVGAGKRGAPAPGGLRRRLCTAAASRLLVRRGGTCVTRHEEERGRWAGGRATSREAAPARLRPPPSLSRWSQGLCTTARPYPPPSPSRPRSRIPPRMPAPLARQMANEDLTPRAPEVRFGTCGFGFRACSGFSPHFSPGLGVSAASRERSGG